MDNVFLLNKELFECEQKYIGDRESLITLVDRLSELEGVVLLGDRSYTFTTDYLDTEDYDIRQSGFSLRHRENNKTTDFPEVFELKQIDGFSIGNTSCRMEIPFTTLKGVFNSTSGAQPSNLPKVLHAALLKAEGNTEKVFSIECERREIRLLVPQNDIGEIEIALDKIKVFNKKSILTLVDNELEIEFKKNNEQAFVGLNQLITDMELIGLGNSCESKAEKAYRSLSKFENV